MVNDGATKAWLRAAWRSTTKRTNDNQNLSLHLHLDGRMTVLRYEENEWGVRRAPSPNGGHSATAGMLFESNAWMLQKF